MSMQRFSSDDVIPETARGAAVALGNFDGVHLGHQAVLAAARAANAQRPLAAAVFEPHPRRLFQPDAPPFRLQSADQRARALEACGVDTLFEIRFDRALASLTDNEFSAQVLAGRLGAGAVSVGFDFHYGRGRMGNAERLRAQGAALGFEVQITPAITGGAHAEKVSSTAIREAIIAGDMAEAARMLSRPWAIEGVVAKGFQRGREIGVPTANIALGDYLRPRLGVYVTRSDLGDGVWRPGVASVGVNPTVGALPEPVLEVYLFDFDGDLYGRRIETQLIGHLRDEEKFDGMDALKAQIARDAQQARAWLKA